MWPLQIFSGGRSSASACGAGPSSLPSSPTRGAGGISGGAGAGSSGKSASPRGGSGGRVGLAPLSMPDDLAVESAPPTGADFGPGSPLAGSTVREIRARPLDIDKEIPLLFVDDGPSAEAPSPYAAAAAAIAPGEGGVLAGVSASRQASANAVGSRVSTSSPHMSTRDAGTVEIPQCVVTEGWEAPLAARKFKRPAHMIRFRSQPSQNVVEYELDDEDLAWLAVFNQGSRQPLLDEEQLEVLLDTLEKASFKALHSASGQRLLLASHAPLPMMAPVHPKLVSPKLPRHPKLDRPPPPTDLELANSPVGMCRRSPQKLPRHPKLDRPPPPTDLELANLPAGLCRRYQQGKCHKGRSCKWKHETWSELAARWERWQIPDSACGGAAGSSTAAPAAASACALASASGSGSTTKSAISQIECLSTKAEDDSLSSLFASELGVVSALELMPPALVARAAALCADVANGDAAMLFNGMDGNFVLDGLSEFGAPSEEADCASANGLGTVTAAGGASAPVAGHGALCGFDGDGDGVLLNLAGAGSSSDGAAGAADGAAMGHGDLAAGSGFGSGFSADASGELADGQISSRRPGIISSGELADGLALNKSRSVVIKMDGAATMKAEAADGDGESSTVIKLEALQDDGASSGPLSSRQQPECGAGPSSELRLPLAGGEGSADALTSTALSTTTTAGMPSEPSAEPQSSHGEGGALAASSLGVVEGTENNEYGVPRVSVRELLRLHCNAARVQTAVYEHWLLKRRRDKEQLPLLNRLRQEAEQMRARQAHLSLAHTDVLGLRLHLQRVRQLLALVKRREKLKAQISALGQAHFEAEVKLLRKSGQGASPKAGGRGKGKGAKVDTKVAVDGNHSQHKRKRAEEAAPAEETAEEEMELEAEGGEEEEEGEEEGGEEEGGEEEEEGEGGEEEGDEEEGEYEEEYEGEDEGYEEGVEEEEAYHGDGGEDGAEEGEEEGEGEDACGEGYAEDDEEGFLKDDEAARDEECEAVDVDDRGAVRRSSRARS